MTIELPTRDGQIEVRRDDMFELTKLEHDHTIMRLDSRGGSIRIDMPSPRLPHWLPTCSSKPLR